MELTGGPASWSSDRYQLRELVGSGGMSQVYRAWDRELDREVAVKVLHPHLAQSPESRRRFSREARAVAKLHHPHILEIFDFSGDGNAAYIVTEFIQGTTLRRFAEEVGFGLPQLAALAAHSLCQALEHAHQAGVVHRDLKPENVMVSRQGRIKLMDFGIARFLEQGEKMTLTGAMVGSPAYMAPEVIEGREADSRSDLFSLGTLLYWLLCGQLPFDAPNTSALLKRVLDVDYRDPRLANPLVPDALATVVSSLLQREPAKRPQSAAEVRTALSGALAEDGLNDPEAALDAFLADPAGFRGRYRGELLARLKHQGARAMAEGRRVAALKIADRLFALEPHNVDAERLLAEVSAQRLRQRRLRRASWALSALGIASLALIAVHTLAERLTPDLPDPPRERVASDRGEAAEPADPNSSTSPPEKPAAETTAETLPSPARPLTPAAVPSPAVRTRGSTQRPGLRDKPGLATRPRLPALARTAVVPTPSPVPLTVVPYNVAPWNEVTLDGRQLPHPSGMSQAAGELRLASGHHVVIFSADNYEPLQTEVEVDADGATPPEIRRRLMPQPAHLTVVAEPSDARVMVDDDMRGSAAESVQRPFPISLLPDQPVATKVVRLFKAGYRDEVRKVSLRANADLRLDVALKPLPGGGHP